MANEIANLGRPHISKRWYRLPALAAFHRLVESVTAGDVHEHAAAPKSRQVRNPRPFGRGTKQHAQRGLDKLGHSALLASRFALKLGHDGIVYIQSCFHMANHITDTAICLQRIAMARIAYFKMEAMQSLMEAEFNWRRLVAIPGFEPGFWP